MHNKPEEALHHNHRKTVLYAIVVGLALGLVLFAVGNNKIKDLTRKNRELDQAIEAQQRQITLQDNVNKGIPEIDNKLIDQVGKIGLLENKVLFDLPEGWSRVREDGCAGGLRDLYILCYEKAAIAPNSLIDSDGNAKLTVNIALYERKSRNSAIEWLEQDYHGQPIGNSNIPKFYIVEESADKLELSYHKIYGTRENPEDMVSYHVVLHDIYTVFISAQLVYRGTHSERPFDYRQDFAPELEKFVKTIKFND